MASMTRAVILAAGRGSRLRPYTDTLPKCFVSFAGKRLIDWQCSALRAGGISEIAVVRGYRGEVFDGMDIVPIDNPDWQETNMVYSLSRAVDWLLAADRVVISYSDIVYQDTVVTELLKSQGPISVVVDLDWRSLWSQRFDNPLDDAETLRMLDDGKITEIGRKTRSLDDIAAQYIGLIAATREGLRTMYAFWHGAAPDAAWLGGQPATKCYMTDLLMGLIGAGVPVQGVPVHGGWLEFDTERDIAVGNELLAAGSLPFFSSSAAKEA